MSLIAGTKLGPYEILAPIGAGGMGEVYRARDTRLGRVVAIKLLPPDKIADPERKRRFIQEARAASALNHPNIVTIYDIGSEDGADFIVMEYIEGKSLDRVIPRGGMRLTEALNTMIPVADALAKAHANGIIHRDLKPANILVTDDGTVKLLDFGLAKLIEDKPSSTAAPGESAATVTLGAAPDAPLTEEGAILGTVAYMSPEQAEGKTIDARSDIFSFGSVLYEMLTGQKAFQGGSRAATIAEILKEDPAPLSDAATGIPRELERMIARCLRKDPAKRWQTAADLRTSLQEFKEDSDSGLTRSGASGIASATAPPTRSHKLAWGIAAVSVIAALGVTLWAVRGSVAKESSTSTAIHPAPLTSYPGEETAPYFSPDGTQVAFSWDGEKQDNFDIYVKRIGPGPPLRLTHDPAEDNYPAWSPDGGAIAFLRKSTGGRKKIMLIPPLGGPEREVADVAALQATNEALEWTVDGRWLIAFDRPAKQPGGLFLISPESGERKRLTTDVDSSANAGEISAAVSPDGRMLAFVRQVTGNEADLFLLPLHADNTPDGEPRRLTNQNRVMNSATWQRDGRALIAGWGEPGDEPLWRIPIDDPAKAIPLTDQDETTRPSVSRMLNRLVYSQSTREMDVYRVELAANGFDARGAQPVAASSRLDRRPSFSPDGKKIAFASVRSGKWQLWVSASDGTDPIALSSFERGEVRYSSWSPDGRQIVFADNAEGESAAYIVDSSGGKPRKLAGLGEVAGIQYSQDGKWFYYVSNVGGATQLWKILASGGMPVQLTHGGIANRLVSVSPDDSLIYFTRPGAIWSVPTAGGPERLVVEYNLDDNVAPAVGRQGLYFLAGTTTRKAGEMLFYPFPHGPVRKVTGVDKPSRYGHAISADGRYLLYTKMVSEGSDLMLVENFK